MDTLRNFYENAPIREAVHAYLIDSLRDEILSRAFLGKDIKDIAEAKKVIDKAFANLNGKYAKKREVKPQNI
jgi:hypothetical protein